MRSKKQLSSFGGLDRVDFLFLGFRGGFDVCGHVAGPVFPFQRRIRCGFTIHARGIFRHSLAPHAFLHDRQAVPFVIAAAGGCHEYTVFPFPNRCTDHDAFFLNPCGFNLSKPEKLLYCPISSMFQGSWFPGDFSNPDG